MVHSIVSLLSFVVQTIMRVLWGEGEEEQIVDEELLGEDWGEVPSGEVLQGDESQQIVAPLGVVPGAGAVLPQQHTCNVYTPLGLVIYSWKFRWRIN